MEFRWVALIALWTFLSGPVLSGLWPQSKSAPPMAQTVVVKAQK